MSHVRMTGDWDKTAKIAATMQGKFERAVERAVLQEAHFLRGKMVRGLASGSPGGSKFAPLSPLTLALRKAGGFGGSKPLNRTGTLRRSISVVKVPGNRYGAFVGVLRKAKSTDGSSLANVGQIQEFGATIPVTDKMRRFIAAKLREAGIEMPRAERASGAFIGPAMASGATRTFRIPPRPFINPVLRVHGKPAAMRLRLYASIGKSMGGVFGGPTR